MLYQKKILEEVDKYVQELQNSDGFDFSTNQKTFRSSIEFKFNDEDLIDVLNDAIEQRKSNILIPFLLNRHQMNEFQIISKAVFHFVLDKLLHTNPPDASYRGDTANQELDSVSGTDKTEVGLEGGRSANHALVLLEVLKKIKIPPALKDFLSPAEEEQFSKLTDTLQQALSFVALYPFITFSKYTNNEYKNLIVKRLNYLSSDEILLIPYGCKEHSTCIAFKLTSEGKVSVSLYNTGQGLTQNHPKFMDSNKYQTRLSYQQVPLESLLETGKLDSISYMHYQCFTAEEMYKAFHALCREGIMDDPSLNPRNYEQEQMQGTCSAQCLMAFLRDQLLSLPFGTELQRFGLYKAFKAHVIVKLTQDRMPWIDEKISNNAQIQLEKYQEEIQLTALAVDKGLFEMTRKIFCAFFQSHQQSAISDALLMMPSVTSLNRYASLRLMHVYLSKHLLKNPWDLADLSEFRLINLNYAMKRLSKYQMNLQTLPELLKKLENKGDWEEIITLVARIRTFFPDYVDVADDWISKMIPRRPELTIEHPFIKLLAGRFKGKEATIDNSPGLRALRQRARSDIIGLLREAVAVAETAISKEELLK